MISTAGPRTRLLTGARRAVSAVALAVAAAVLSACASASPGSEPGMIADQLVGRWVPTVEGAAPEAFLAFAEDGSLTLSDGCNGAQGEWSLEDGALTVSSGPSTKMYCDGYVDIHTWIANTDSARIDDGLLQLVGADDEVLGEFTPDTSGARNIDGIGDGTLPITDPAQLVGRWTSDPRSTPDSFVEYRADGTLEFVDGCNSGSGTWTLGESGYVTSEAISTLIGCDVTDPVMPVDGSQVRTDGERLTIALPTDGTVVLVRL